MKGHRREQSESHTPLRQSEIQSSPEAPEIRITFNSKSEAITNGSVNQTSIFVDIPNASLSQTPRSGR
jgi:hypothetical protein